MHRSCVAVFNLHSTNRFGLWITASPSCALAPYLTPPMSIPPQGTTVPPHPGGNRHQVTVPPLGGGGWTRGGR